MCATIPALARENLRLPSGRSLTRRWLTCTATCAALSP